MEYQIIDGWKGRREQQHQNAVRAAHEALNDDEQESAVTLVVSIGCADDDAGHQVQPTVRVGYQVDNPNLLPHAEAVAGALLDRLRGMEHSPTMNELTDPESEMMNRPLVPVQLDNLPAQPPGRAAADYISKPNPDKDALDF